MCGWSPGFGAVYCVADDSSSRDELSAHPSSEVNYNPTNQGRTRYSYWGIGRIA
jgi:hypothetical protein